MSKQLRWRVISVFLLSAIPLTVFSDDNSNPELIYAALNVGEWKLIFSDPDTGVPRVGATVYEKSVGGLLCRKIVPVVFQPVPRFQCYLQLTLSNELAMTLFQLLNTGVEVVSFLDPVSDVPRVGASVSEKSKDDLLCQSVSAVIPDAIPAYTCYADIEEDTLRLEKRHVGKDRDHGR
jgi:hypothetical protein